MSRRGIKAYFQAPGAEKKFVDTCNLDYSGPVPEFKYFMPPGGIGISETQYKDYASKYPYVWNLRRETEWYCNQDCLVLYEVLIKFNADIFRMFRVEVSKYPTLSSLAFATIPPPPGGLGMK